MARKLASIQKIVNIEPIEGADKIEKLTVLGWHIVASKSENHNIGDLICYIEPDSRVPEIPMFEFLKDRKYIVKTIKLRKQVSQGLVIPLRELQKNFNIDIATLKEGQDVTDLLGITKYDPEGEKEQKLAEQEIKKVKNPIHKFLMRYKWYRKIYTQLFVPKKGGFPQWIKKTDENRLQTMPDEFYSIVNNPNETILFDSTEKIDRSICNIFYRKNKKIRII